MSYATPAQMANYFDARKLCELVSDTGTPIGYTNPPVLATMLAALASNMVILELLEAASNEVLSACQVGKRYGDDDLTALAADANLGGKLRRITAQLTWGYLVNRRGYASEEFTKLAPGYALAMRDLELLRLGERIFPINNADLAGLPDSEAMGVSVCGSIASKVGLWGTAALPNGEFPRYPEENY